MKRHLIKFVLFLFLGTAISVAVAWGCAIWPYHGGIFLGRDSWPGSDYELISPEGFQTNIWKRTGELRISQTRVMIPMLTGIRLLPLPQRINDSQYRDLLPDWSAFAAPAVLGRSDARFFVEQAAGWPLLCLRLTSSKFFGDGRASRYSKMRGRLELPWFEPPWRNTVPYQPIWPGFVINTIFYAAILWLLSLGPFTARRMIRRKRGRCIKCGYDLRATSGGSCPECGWKHPRRQTSPA